MVYTDAELRWWIFVAVLATILVMLVLIALAVDWIRDYFYDWYNQYLYQYCQNLGPIAYDHRVFAPEVNGEYQKELAEGLYEVAANVSNANCTQALPLPNPIGYTNQQILRANDPISNANQMYGYLFWNQSSAIIAFTGTSNIDEWTSDFNYPLTPAVGLNGYTEGVDCHRGFYNIYMAVRPQLWDWYQIHHPQNLFITGHSLGGALSTICSFDFASVKSEVIHYSFGAPRSGSVIYAQTFNQRVPQSIRVANTEDVVPALPPATWEGNTYQQTGGNLPFTVSLGSLPKDHIQAYAENLPQRAMVAPSYREPNSQSD